MHPPPREVAPIHFILDQGRGTAFWEVMLFTLARCSRPHNLTRSCRPAETQYDYVAKRWPQEVRVFAPWERVVEIKRTRLAQRLSDERSRCAGLRPFQIPGAAHVAAESTTTPSLRQGQRALLVGLTSKSMRRYNGSIVSLVAGANRQNGLVPVSVISPVTLDESEQNRPITWMIRPDNLRLGEGATPEEWRWCELNNNLPLLPSSSVQKRTVTPLPPDSLGWRPDASSSHARVVLVHIPKTGGEHPMLNAQLERDESTILTPRHCQPHLTGRWHRDSDMGESQQA